MSARSLARVVALAAIALPLAYAPPALAADDEAAATELFIAGRDRMKQGDYAAACPMLAESVRLKPTVGALAKLAGCEEHERRLVSARARWQQALNLARSVGDDRASEVAGELMRIDGVVPKLVLATQAPLPPEAMIRVDDLQLGAASVGVPLSVEPGKHVVAVSAPRKVAWSTEVETTANGATTSLAIPALADAPTPAPPPAAPPLTVPTVPLASLAEAHPSGQPVRVAALVAAGVGVVGLGVGTVLAIDAMGKKSDARCTGNVCPDAASAATLEGAKSAANASTIAFVAGGALVAGGLTLFLLTPRATTARASGATIEVQPTLGGLVVRGRWF